MRLPEFFTALSPVQDTLEALHPEQAAMEAETERQNQRLLVGTADEAGLALWEADYGLPSGAGLQPEMRRARIRAAMSSGTPLTTARLKELCVTIGGYDRGEIQEDFSHWRLTVTGVSVGKAPPEEAPLRQAVERLRPAHLEIDVTPRGDFSSNMALHLGLTGAYWVEIHTLQSQTPVGRPGAEGAGGKKAIDALIVKE